MFSSPLRLMASTLLSASLLTGVLSCTPKIGEDPPPPLNQEFGGTACLTDATRVAEEFMFGNAKPNEISGAWDCFSNAFISFHKYVRGNSRDSYTPQELATFFERNFFRADGIGSDGISPALQNEFMKFKQIFVGGARDVVTRDELLALVRLFGNLKELTLRVNPYVKIFIMKWQPEDPGLKDEEVDHFEQANQVIQSVARDLGALIQLNHQAYHMDDLIVFIDELGKFYGSTWDGATHVQRLLPVAKKIKAALTGGSEEDVLGNEWRTMLILGSRAYVQYLRYHYFIKEPIEAGRSVRINYVARTFEDSFSVFEDLVREKPSGQVTRAEIDGILTAFSNAWPTFRWSDPLVVQFMKIKQVMFGGSLENFAVSDFENARLKVSRLSLIMERFLPYYAVYGGEWDPKEMTRQEAYAYFHEALVALESSGRELGSLLESSYDINNLSAFLSEWNRLYPPVDPDDRLDLSLKKYLPTLKLAKNMIYDEDDSTIKKSQWGSLLGFASRIYATSMFSGYFLKKFDTQSSRDLAALSVMTDMGISLAKDMLKVKSSKALNRSEVMRLVTEAQRLDVLPGDISRGSLDSAVRAFLGRFATPPEKRLSDGRGETLRASNLDYLRGEFQGWLQAQILLNKIFDGSDETTLPSDTVWKSIERKYKDGNTSPELKKSLGELMSILSTDVRFVLDSQKRLIIGSTYKYNLRSLERHNLIRAVTRLLIGGYAGSLSRVRNGTGVTLGEAETAFKEFRGLAIEMDMVEPDNKNFMGSRFREANIFVPRADGNNYASFLEVHEIIFTIFSGLELDSKLKPQLIKTCRGGNRTRNSSLVTYSCLYNVYKQIFPSKLTSMTNFLAYQRAQTDAVFNVYFSNALKGAGHADNGKGTVKMADIALLPHLIQYIELIFARYDTDDNGGLTVGEAMRAFPAFRDLFKELAKKEIESGTIEEKDLPALFTYILRYGKPPSGVWEGLTRWIPWKNNPASWDHFADRTKIAEILGFIADQVNNSSNPIVPKQNPQVQPGSNR